MNRQTILLLILHSQSNIGLMLFKFYELLNNLGIDCEETSQTKIVQTLYLFRSQGLTFPKLKVPGM